MYETDTVLFRQVVDALQSRQCEGVFHVQTGARRQLVLVELKGKRLRDAAAQLQSTLAHVRILLAEADCENVELHAVAVVSAAPRQNREVRTRFERATGVRLVVMSRPLFKVGEWLDRKGA